MRKWFPRQHERVKHTKLETNAPDTFGGPITNGAITWLMHLVKQMMGDRAAILPLHEVEGCTGQAQRYVFLGNLFVSSRRLAVKDRRRQHVRLLLGKTTTGHGLRDTPDTMILGVAIQSLLARVLGGIDGATVTGTKLGVRLQRHGTEPQDCKQDLHVAFVSFLPSVSRYCA